MVSGRTGKVLGQRSRCFDGKPEPDKVGVAEKRDKPAGEVILAKRKPFPGRVGFRARKGPHCVTRRKGVATIPCPYPLGGTRQKCSTAGKGIERFPEHCSFLSLASPSPQRDLRTHSPLCAFLRPDVYQSETPRKNRDSGALTLHPSRGLTTCNTRFDSGPHLARALI
ncbi:hypothetical protein AAFF_G00122180 [Aldrovandia affinis]|uniref:Uncharacterized protein n=1 Tax=Aldrovandia affinis TaxID=143900 RepID=A0AAD7RRQ9_9TELE|nr:hypothetical protein AAFF_G00122180 [Aldrovandia affinis]